jgi:acylphosphatase
MAAELESRRVLYSGRVQGVGFRYTAERATQGLAVTGFVRNLRDGRVELVAEGTAIELDRLLAAISQAMGVNIEDQAVEIGPASGKFTAFKIAP